MPRPAIDASFRHHRRDRKEISAIKGAAHFGALQRIRRGQLIGYRGND
jgi:hypothetical protein